jgi:hypothetical protein
MRVMTQSISACVAAMLLLNAAPRQHISWQDKAL